MEFEFDKKEERMRILIVSDISSYMTGGVPAETRMLINGLEGLGHVVAFANDAPLSGCGCSHYRISLPIGEKFASELSKVLESFRPDFVHVICMNSSGVVSLSKILSSHRWALTAHSIPPYERKLSSFHSNESLHYAARALRFLPNSTAWRWVFSKQFAPAVIVHSEFVKDIALNYGCEEKRVVLIPLPFVTSSAKISEVARGPLSGEISIVCVGGLAHTKGQHDLIHAMEQLVAKNLNIKCDLIGEVRDETYLRYLKELIQRGGLVDRIRITVNASDEVKESLLKSADIYVQPSHEEGFCLAFAEGASVVPRVVGTATGAMRAMGAEDPGIRIVPTKDSKALSVAISDLVAFNISSDTMANRLRRLHDASSLETYLRLHVQEYSRKR